jgi:hypothetical protein
MSRETDHVEIHDYLARFWRAMDRSDYEAVLAGLTEDCRWLRDRWREGRDDILLSLQARPPLAASRHCIANLILDPADGGYDAQYGLIIFGHPKAADPAEPPYRTTGPRMGDWTSRLAKVGGEWRAREIRAALVFERA